uniref:Solute carrier family 26 member 11 n=2 Tax=Eptatretus burgeri TaxID=7764 RepID=A0A8C4R0E4_EPTBU
MWQLWGSLFTVLKLSLPFPSSPSSPGLCRPPWPGRDTNWELILGMSTQTQVEKDRKYPDRRTSSPMQTSPGQTREATFPQATEGEAWIGHLRGVEFFVALGEEGGATRAVPLRMGLVWGERAWKRSSCCLPSPYPVPHFVCLLLCLLTSSHRLLKVACPSTHYQRRPSMVHCLHRCLATFSPRRRFPLLKWVPKYSLHAFGYDTIAGLTVGLTVVPQALAYAQLAGLSVQFGLYSSIMGGFVYCLLGTSKDITLGPTAIMSALIAPLVHGDVVYATILAFLCGCVQLLLGLFQLGFIMDFISEPVIKGFTCAASLIICVTQVKNLLGLQDIPRQFFLLLYHIFAKLAETRPGDATLGFLCIIFLLLLKVIRCKVEDVDSLTVKIAKKITWLASTGRNVLVILAAALVSFAFSSFHLQPFVITGEVQPGLPTFHPPPFSEERNGTVITFSHIVQDLGTALLVIPLVGFMESIAIAKAFARDNKYPVDPSQELIAIGTTNIFGSFLSAFPVTGSFTRTAVNSQSGVCTPAGGLITGVLVLLSLQYLTPCFYYIPCAALASIIICSVAPVFDVFFIRDLWRVKKLNMLPFVLTFGLCFYEMQIGILVGVAMSLIIALYPLTQPTVMVCYTGPVVVLQPRGALLFLGAESFREVIQSKIRQVEPQLSVILDCSWLSSLDYTAVITLRELQAALQAQRLRLAFVALHADVLDVLLRADLPELRHFESVEQALSWMLGSQDTEYHLDVHSGI